MPRNGTDFPHERGARPKQFGDSSVSIQEAVSQSLFSYWNTIRGNRPAPKRFEIEPSRIADNLPDAFILEHVNALNIRFRLAGTRIIDALGMELRGKNLFDLFGPEDAKTLQAQMGIIAEQCAVGVFRMSADNGEGLGTTFEVLILPLTHTRNSVERFLGALTSIEKPGWLGAVPLRNLKLLDHEMIWPTGEPLSDADAALHPRPVLHTRRAARIVRSSRRQFRVYDGGLTLAGDEQ